MSEQEESNKKDYSKFEIDKLLDEISYRGLRFQSGIPDNILFTEACKNILIAILKYDDEQRNRQYNQIKKISEKLLKFEKMFFELYDIIERYIIQAFNINRISIQGSDRINLFTEAWNNFLLTNKFEIEKLRKESEY